MSWCRRATIVTHATGWGKSYTHTTTVQTRIHRNTDENERKNRSRRGSLSFFCPSTLSPIQGVPKYRPPCQHRISTGPGGLCGVGDRRSINQAYADAPSTHTHYVHGPTRISTTTTVTTTTATATTACLATAAVCFRSRVRSVRHSWLFNKYINTRM